MMIRYDVTLTLLTFLTTTRNLYEQNTMYY